MFLTLKNIGKISEATIELAGITVIAGENNTGKSTIGKVLFCIFNSFYRLEQQVDYERLTVIEDVLESFTFRGVTKDTWVKRAKRVSIQRADIVEISKSILNKRVEYLKNTNSLKLLISDLFVFVNENSTKVMINDISEKIIQILQISDKEIFQTVLQKKLESEFNNQINNIFSENEDGEIELRIKNTCVKVFIKNDEVKRITDSFSLNTEVVYMDDPFALDDLSVYSELIYNNSNYIPHRAHLKNKLRQNNDLNSSIKNALNEIIASKKLDSIIEKINTVCNGEMVRTKRLAFGYKRKSSDAVLDIRNISTGLKTFVILKTLLLNGSLVDNGTIVLDEPEIHLHPEWQLLFAELIVLIQKEFGMHILLNTHSPYFLNAIEVYAAKYELADKCKYYLAENSSDGKSNIIDVTTNIEKIYDKLSRPLQVLENERFGND